MLRAARVVMASLEMPQACTLAAFSIARQAGATTLLNPAPAGPLPDGLLPLVDILTPNAGELRNLAGAAPDADEAQCAQRLLARGAGAVVVTLGAHGCRLYQPGGSAPTAWAGHVVQVVDTVGAGDTFTGTLAAALARGDTLAHAVLQANAAAALSVRGRGATTAMPDRQAVRALLAQRPGARDGRAG